MAEGKFDWGENGEGKMAEGKMAEGKMAEGKWLRGKWNRGKWPGEIVRTPLRMDPFMFV
jgi:hypothetical protein